MSTVFEYGLFDFQDFLILLLIDFSITLMLNF